MFHEIYEVPAEINFYFAELNIHADVICTTYQLDSDFKEVLKVTEEPTLKTVDNRSIDLNFNYEVEIKNYTTAKQGQMPTYDSDKGIRPIIGIRVKFIFECEVENKTCSVLISLGNL